MRAVVVVAVCWMVWCSMGDDTKPTKSLAHSVLAGAGLVSSAKSHNAELGEIEVGGGAAVVVVTIPTP